MFLSVLLISFSHPLFLAISFAACLLFISLTLALMVGNYFFSYLIFLLFASGVLIIIMYLCSVVLLDRTLMQVSGWVGVGVFLGPLIFNFPLSKELSESGLGLLFEFYGLFKFLIYPYGMLSVFMIGYLFVCLVIIYEIVKKCDGPLRIKT